MNMIMIMMMMMEEGVFFTVMCYLFSFEFLSFSIFLFLLFAAFVFSFFESDFCFGIFFYSSKYLFIYS